MKLLSSARRYALGVLAVVTILVAFRNIIDAHLRGLVPSPPGDRAVGGRDDPFVTNTAGRRASGTAALLPLRRYSPTETSEVGKADEAAAEGKARMATAGAAPTTTPRPANVKNVPPVERGGGGSVIINAKGAGEVRALLAGVARNASGSSARAAGDDEPTAIVHHVNMTNITSRRVYACGWDNGNLHRYLFPDYADMGRLDSDPLPPRPTSDSVLVLGEHGPCRRLYRMGGRATQLMNETGGKVLYVNGEGRVLFHSLLESTDVQVRGFFGPAVLISHYSPQQWEEIFDPSKRPRNNGQRYLMYLVSRCFTAREEAFDALAQIGTSKAYYGGKCKGLNGNNTAVRARRIPPRNDGTDAPWRDNYMVFRDYRFCLVMEHKKKDGYITEKLINGFLGGCIPIYYGTKEVFEIFNKRAFIYYDPLHPRFVLNRVACLERNRTAYDEVMNEPILAKGNDTIEEHFSLTDSVGGGKLKSRIREMLGVPSGVA